MTRAFVLLIALALLSSARAVHATNGVGFQAGTEINKKLIMAKSDGRIVMPIWIKWECTLTKEQFDEDRHLGRTMVCIYGDAVASIDAYCDPNKQGDSEIKRMAVGKLATGESMNVFVACQTGGNDGIRGTAR